MVQNKHKLLNSAYSDLREKKFSSALKILKKISNWSQDMEALLGIAHCYQEMGQYQKALETFKSIPNWENDKQALLGLAHCYEKMGLYQKGILSISQGKRRIIQMAIIHEALEMKII